MLDPRRSTRTLAALVVGILSTLALWLLDVDYFVIIGLFAGLTNLIPYLGPVSGATAAALVSIVTTGSFDKVIPIVIAFSYDFLPKAMALWVAIEVWLDAAALIDTAGDELGVTGLARHPNFPTAPTLAESGWSAATLSTVARPASIVRRPAATASSSSSARTGACSASGISSRRTVTGTPADWSALRSTGIGWAARTSTAIRDQGTPSIRCASRSR